MRHPFRFLIAVLALMLLASFAAQADPSLPHVFGSHMVLQRDIPIPVWGWAEAGEKIEVKLGDVPAVAATTDAGGAWRVDLPAQKAGGPVKLTVTGKTPEKAITFDDVLIGEVWLCSGQSNMEMQVVSSKDFDKEKADAANYPQIRQVYVPHVPAGSPQKDFTGSWNVCSPDTVGGYTAAGYFMARKLYQELKVPIGLLHSSWGGSAIDPWCCEAGYAQVPALKGTYDQVLFRNPTSPAHKQFVNDYIAKLDAWITLAKEAVANEKTLNPAPGYPDELKPYDQYGTPTGLYSGMIAPLAPYGMRGAIWYQGESNHGEGMLYAEKTKALVQGWRAMWKQGDFPFYWVQIAPYRYGEENPTIMPTFWEAQEAATKMIPNTGMVVINDVAMLDNIHPVDKQAVGMRLALLALNKTYGKKDVVCSGPTFKSLSQEGAKLRVNFDSVGGGLISRDGKPLTNFEVIGGDSDWAPADAAIDGASVVLTAAGVAKPVAMRFAWNKLAEPNLSNKEGLPTGAFRAGEIPKIDYLAIKVPEAKDYKLIYDLDLAKLSANPQYDAVNPDKFAGEFDRIAYFIELRKAGETVQYAWVAMDAFTNDLTKIGVPTVASKAVFQVNVKNMNVISNVKDIVNGVGLPGGNLEFWPHNYGPPNTANVPNASNDIWDFGDQYSDPVDGYGSMQVANHDAKQTIFAINQWKSGGDHADIGIGNSPDIASNNQHTRDWTFFGNGGSYTQKRLRVLIHPKG